MIKKDTPTAKFLSEINRVCFKHGFTLKARLHLDKEGIKPILALEELPKLKESSTDVSHSKPSRTKPGA